MRMKTSRTTIVGISLVIGSTAILFITLYRALVGTGGMAFADADNVPVTALAPTTSTEQSDIQVSSTMPARLIVSSLDIVADIQKVGLKNNGAMAAPSNYTDVAWYSYGVKPGQNGSAVIAGHLDNGLGRAGVFKKLSEVGLGDEVIVEYEDGTRQIFRIISRRAYPYNDPSVAKEIFSTSGAPRLVLITCDGAWMQSMRTYAERFIVTAEYARPG